MTASEKLRALLAAEVADRDHSDNSAANELRNALPALADVVEAAERIPDVGKLWSHDVRAALSALNEALGGDVT